MWIFSLIIADVKPNDTATGDEKQNQPEAEQQGSPEEQSMEMSSDTNGSHDKEKRKEAKVSPIFTKPKQHIFNLKSCWRPSLAISASGIIWTQYLRSYFRNAKVKILKCSLELEG